ncbi:MAG: hypothetical protein KKF33_18115 [Alphaproteobacteria bacterium]|nr:hypothetical protein [Alphaproteobacteria bacterium]
MARLLTLLMLAGALSACSTGIPGPQNPQFSGAEETFPADYQARALRALGDQAVAGMSVSYPQAGDG